LKWLRRKVKPHTAKQKKKKEARDEKKGNSKRNKRGGASLVTEWGGGGINFEWAGQTRSGREEGKPAGVTKTLVEKHETVCSDTSKRY